jgi:hypothetical protein
MRALLAEAGRALAAVRAAQNRPRKALGLHEADIRRAETGTGSLRQVVRLASALGLTVRIVFEPKGL